MKIVYCIHSLYNPGGMERVMLGKVAYLKAHTDWDISIVTTNQGGRPVFFDLPDGVRLTDLDINYESGAQSRALKKILIYLRKKKLHRQRLTALLMKENTDIVVSLFPSESSFIPKIKDGSKKVLELHFNRYFRTQYGRGGLVGIIDRIREKSDLRLVRKFDRFVVLTDEDNGYWGNLPNMVTISNPSLFKAERISDTSRHRVIAVGRLDYQKGFDRLLKAWETICRQDDLKDWVLDIYGKGEWEESLQKQIQDGGMAGRAFLRGTTSDIAAEFADSAFIAMSSHYEGLPMVLIEAMTCGLPAVSFACKCGPRDIIQDGVNGLLVPDGDCNALASAMMKVMRDDTMRRTMGTEALKVREKYNEDVIMAQWISMFESIRSE
ncbi:MAG: glycosyltransferase family 4 protein [Bacteroidales bacterium]|nr:glycosyltransferase family 4 protein [Bacteroidales bacterium]